MFIDLPAVVHQAPIVVIKKGTTGPGTRIGCHKVKEGKKKVKYCVFVVKKGAWYRLPDSR